VKLFAVDDTESRVAPLREYVRPPWTRTTFFWLLPFSLYVTAALLLQRAADATAMGFGTYPDEPSHYLSGLMTRDYLVSGMAQGPLAYASDYYLHIPMIGIGHWPPGFYFLQAVWMLIAGVSRGDILVLIAIITALAAFSVYRATESDLGAGGALITGGMLLMVPIVRWSNNLVMSDTLVAVLIFRAALAFGRFVASERFSDAVRFGLLASLALLTKPAAGCLIFLPPLTILVTRKFHLLRRPPLWGSAGVVVCLCGPWYLATGQLNFFGAPETPERASDVLAMFFARSGRQMDFLAALAVMGVIAWLRHRPAITAKGAVLISLPFSVLGMSLFSGLEAEPRYLIPALLPMVALAGYGFAWLASVLRVAGIQPHARIAVLCALSGVVYAMRSPAPVNVVSSSDGLRDLLDRVSMERRGAAPLLLIAGSSPGADGRIIAGLAERMTERPSGILVRAEKVLAVSNWAGDNYALRFHTQGQVIEELDRFGVSLIACDTSPRWGAPWPHHTLLLQALEQARDRAQLIYASNPPAYRLYRFRSSYPPRVPAAVLENLNEKVGHLPFRKLSPPTVRP
jgi:Dolichyl-phosphate-mannose-protein mannosyltransferase